MFFFLFWLINNYSKLKGGAADGTTCASGRICIQGQCTSSSSALTGDCLFPDDVLRQGFSYGIFGFRLPNAVMTCQELIDYTVNTLRYSSTFLCSIPSFKNMCCNTCKSKIFITFSLNFEFNFFFGINE